MAIKLDFPHGFPEDGKFSEEYNRPFARLILAERKLSGWFERRCGFEELWEQVKDMLAMMVRRESSPALRQDIRQRAMVGRNMEEMQMVVRIAREDHDSSTPLLALRGYDAGIHKELKLLDA